MATIVPSIGLKGIEGYKVQVEVQLIPYGEGVSIVGLPDVSVKESKERVMAALYTMNCRIINKRIVINLSPAEQKKNSPIFDLAMAVAIMKETGNIKYEIPKDAAFLGVLSLDGTIKTIDGILPAIIGAKKEGFKILYLPPAEHLPIKQVDGIELRFVKTIQQVIESFSGQLTTFSIIPPESSNINENIPIHDKDFKYVIGHKQAKRALEIAAVGGHNVLMFGPPGCGKSMLAETFPSILPPLKQESQFEVMSIYQLAKTELHHFQLPPFRSPHHSASAVSLIGGGSHPLPGEVSLAHRGVLFLDEMAEYSKRTLDMLRQPIENGKVTISRAASTVTYPAQFLLIGAMNPCPCGYLGSNHYYCTCTTKQITTYSNRISGPIQDRMDIILKLDAVSLNSENTDRNEASFDIRKRVIAARERQYRRYNGEIYNAIARENQLSAYIQLTEKQEMMLNKWSSEHNWSTRVQVKLLRLARTISDLQAVEQITDEAIWEAVTLRRTSLQRLKKGMVK